MASRAWWACAFGGLAGCPFVVDPVPTFTDDVGVTPEIRSVVLSPRLNGVRLHLDAVDPQHDLEGGEVLVSDGTTEHTLVIPDDFENEGFVEGSSSAALVPLGPEWLFPDLDPGAGFEPDCDEGGTDSTWTITVVDAAGHTSAPEVRSLVVPQSYGTLDEAPFPISSAGQPPLLVCVRFDGADDLERQEDVERFEFSTPVGGEYFVHLEWGPMADLNFTLFALPSMSVVVREDAAVVKPPAEAAYFTVEGGESWRISVDFATADGGTFPPYISRVLVTPEPMTGDVAAAE